MKKLIISLIALPLLFSCSSNEKPEENPAEINETPEEKEEVKPLLNMYGEDSIDADGNVVMAPVDEATYEINKEVVPQIDSVSGRKYKLGPLTDKPLSNIYGEDSIGPDGNFVYPSRDTIWMKDNEQE